MLSAGTLPCRVALQANTPTQDDVGQPIAGWATVTTRWADVRHESGMESIKGDADASSVKASVRLRLPVDVTTAMRVVGVYPTVIAGKIYEIRAVLPDAQSQDHIDLSVELLNA